MAASKSVLNFFFFFVSIIIHRPGTRFIAGNTLVKYSGLQRS